MSPFIHKELFSAKGIEAEYEKSEIAPEDLPREFEGRLRFLDGFNVTIPHKVEIISLLHELDEAAEFYGAVNTVCRRDGRLCGFNTDGYGFLKGLELSGICLSGRTAVYGFGGAARTVIAEGLKAGCEVTVITTPDRVEKAKSAVAEIEEKTGGRIAVISEKDICGEYDLLINASPVGMYPRVGASPLSEEQLSCFSAVYDLVYNPEETELLRLARRLGIKCGGGMSMLVCQAERAHEIWYGAEFSAEQTESIISLSAKHMREVFGE